MTRYEWLLFDADGTLFDYDFAESTALANTFQQLGIPFMPEYTEIYRAINGEIWREFELGRISQLTLRSSRFERLFERLEIDANPEDFSQAYLLNLSMRTELVDGAEKITKALYERYNLAIITNGLKDVQRPRLTRSSIGRFFDVLIISEEVGAAKPDPKIFEAAFELVGNPARESVMIIGDSLTSDIAGGFAYGIDTCWFNPARLARDPALEIRYEVSDLLQILDILSPGGASRASV
jgi:YjjG family noncanonical pyrimidine nucleotidase